MKKTVVKNDPLDKQGKGRTRYYGPIWSKASAEQK